MAGSEERAWRVALGKIAVCSEANQEGLYWLGFAD